MAGGGGAVSTSDRSAAGDAAHYVRRILPGAGPGPVAALAALLYLDSRLATAHATAFLNRHDRGGAGSTHQPLPGSDPRQQQRRLARLCAFADTHTASPPSVL
ncbi:MAG: hypothetical protein V7603_1987 [Micromonosporaceae bacterium]